MHPPAHPLLLLLGPAAPIYPEPLQSLSENFQIIPLPTLHEIAAILATEKNIHALLLDPPVLTRKILQALPLLTRHYQIPLLLLPITSAASPAARSAHLHQILPWNEWHPTATHPFPMSNNQSPMNNEQSTMNNSHPPSQTDNPISPNPPAPTEISLTIHPAKRYDELDNTPLVSPQEMAALLGVIEQ